jgi:hypothetical protein
LRRRSLATELVKTEEGAEYVCQLCFDHHYTKCCCCDRVFVTPSMISSPNDEPYCETCADDVICHCSECGEAVWREDCDHTEDRDAMCEGCYRGVCSNNLDNPDDWCDLYIHNYSYDVRAALGLLGSPKDRIFYGVELEVVVDGDREDFENAACGVSQSLANFALLKADSSIDPGGFEIVTTAAQFDLHYKHWQSLFDALPSCLRVNSTTGLHVHVSKKRLSQLRMGKILVFLNRDLNRSLCQAIAGRKHCSYAQYKHKNFSHAKENNSDRFEVVAIRSKTLEFRLFAATLDPDVFFARLEFVKALVAFSYETSCRHLSDRRLY